MPEYVVKCRAGNRAFHNSRSASQVGRLPSSPVCSITNSSRLSALSVGGWPLPIQGVDMESYAAFILSLDVQGWTLIMKVRSAPIVKVTGRTAGVLPVKTNQAASSLNQG